MATAHRGSLLWARNWKWVPCGMVRLTPGARGAISSRLPCLRHISPCPLIMYQISSMVRWAMAMDVFPGASSKWAMLPFLSSRSMRTSDPSGAVTSGSRGRCFVLNSVMVFSGQMKIVRHGVRQKGFCVIKTGRQNQYTERREKLPPLLLY